MHTLAPLVRILFFGDNTSNIHVLPGESISDLNMPSLNSIGLILLNLYIHTYIYINRSSYFECKYCGNSPYRVYVSINCNKSFDIGYFLRPYSEGFVVLLH